MSNVALSITGDNPEIFTKNFARIAAQFGYVHFSQVAALKQSAAPAPQPVAEQPPTPSAEAPKQEVLPPVETKVEPQPEAPRRGRPPRKPADAPVEQKQEPAPGSFTEAVDKLDRPAEADIPAAKTDDAKPVTLDDAKDAGRAVMALKGFEALKALIDKFKVPKIAELPADKWAEFIAEANKVREQK